MVLGILVTMAAALNKADLLERDNIGERSVEATEIAYDFEMCSVAASSIRRGPREHIQSARLRGDELEFRALERCDRERERQEAAQAKVDQPGS